MNVHRYEVLNTDLNYNCNATSYITVYVSFDPEKVHLQMEENRKESQGATSDYLVNTTTPNKNILDNTDGTIN